MDDKAKSDFHLDDIQVKKAGHPDLIDSLVRSMQLAQGDTGGARAMARPISHEGEQRAHSYGKIRRFLETEAVTLPGTIA